MLDQTKIRALKVGLRIARSGFTMQRQSQAQIDREQYGSSVREPLCERSAQGNERVLLYELAEDAFVTHVTPAEDGAD